MATITAVQQAAYQRRTLATLQSKAEAMSATWGDIDGYFQGRMEELHTLIGNIDSELTEFIADQKDRPTCEHQE